MLHLRVFRPVALMGALTACTSTSPPAAPAAASPPTPGSVVAPEHKVSLHARLASRELIVRRDGEVVSVYRIAVGKRSAPTPTGTFHIQRLIWNPRWVPPDSPWARGKTTKRSGDPANPMQSVKIFFREPRYYIHGTNQEVSIGRAASQGCIRMTAEDAAALARFLMEHTGQSRSDTWYADVQRLGAELYVQLPRPVALHVTGS